MDKQRVAVLTDVGRLLSRSSGFVYVDYPACGKIMMLKSSIKYVECRECRTFYVNPRPSPNLLEWFYQGSPNFAYWNDVIFPASENARL